MELQNKSAYYLNLGNKYLNLNNVDLAIKNYLLALEEDPENFLIYHNLGVSYLIKNEPKLAFENFKKSIENGFKTVETYYYYLKAAFDCGNYEECLRVKANENFFIDMNLIKIKAAMKLNKYNLALEILEQLKMNGFSSQELNLMEKIINLRNI
ncbi:TPR repeat-containing protein [Marinitoga hydrogenitolerans DSM 16785]|uniref:TPR repeat-containing protein n=1 Tax=Marinitoga hydrogenitolerans (strain DSM 16785 / JCM 12826 / AT1271) TaxID=1122195 RepID=A0A1M4ZZ77_MARH1|nr:TPR repeat-containing protein [Marinitoga hydrogenitolerans DSM 16785]